MFTGSDQPLVGAEDDRTMLNGVRHGPKYYGAHQENDGISDTGLVHGNKRRVEWHRCEWYLKHVLLFMMKNKEIKG